MTLGISHTLHDIIERNNVLQEPTQQIRNFLRNHPLLYKIVLVANHIFRALAMTALTACLPFAPLVNFGICLAGSLIYRLTVEWNCAYKFALPAMAGSAAISLSETGLNNLIRGVAFASMEAFATSIISVLPCIAYLTYVVLTVDYDVEARLL